MIRSVLRDAEIKLVEMMASLEEDTFGWRAVHLHFSKLEEKHQSEYQSRIALNLVLDFMKEGEGGVFLMQDQDIIVLCKGITKSQIDKMVFRLRYLFSEDPLSFGPEGEENPAFVTTFDMTMGYPKVMDLAKQKLVATTQTSRSYMRKDAPAHGELKPITPERLASLEKEVANADLSRVMRRQPICAVIPGKPIRRVYDEFYINIGHLRNLLMANVDFTSNRWLFNYLTEALDRKMLSMLRRRALEYFKSPFSLNLNVSTLLSDSFATFDAALNPAVKVSVVIEIQIADVFSDIKAFNVARRAVQQQGYRVCVDGLTTRSFIQVSREALGFDLAKLQWNPDTATNEESREYRIMQKAVQRCGPNRLILCRCDDKQAVDYGQQLGISLYQGRYLDMLLDPDAKVKN